MTRSTDITSFSDFRARLRDHLDRQKKTGRPLFVTTNGETEAVVLLPAVYDEMVQELELVESLALIERSEEDLKAGRTRPALDAVREMAKNLNLKLDR
jgi:prevent-host-death family protein